MAGRPKSVRPTHLLVSPSNCRTERLGELDMAEVARRVRESFAQQQFMTTLGASLILVREGEVEIEIPFRTELAQQNGFLHAGAITSILDSACGYAAMTMAPEGR